MSSRTHPAPRNVLHLARAERAELADFLADLPPEQWDAPTLCSGWAVVMSSRTSSATSTSAWPGSRIASPAPASAWTGATPSVSSKCATERPSSSSHCSGNTSTHAG